MNWLKRLFGTIFGAVGELLRCVFDAAFQLFMAELKGFAIDSIKRASQTDWSNEEKRKNVLGELKSEALRRALTIKDRQIELGFIAIFNFLKNKGVIK